MRESSGMFGRVREYSLRDKILMLIMLIDLLLGISYIQDEERMYLSRVVSKDHQVN